MTQKSQLIHKLPLMRMLGALSIILIIGICGCLRSKKDANKISIYKQTESKGFPYTISNGRLGTISIGDRIDSTLENLESWFIIKKDSLETCEGCTTYTPIYQILSRESYQCLFSIEPGWEENNKTKVFRIITGNRLFETDREISIGMTVKDIKKAYEIMEISIAGDLGIHIIVKDFYGSFGIELPNIDDWWTINKSTIPDTLKITEIIIVGRRDK